MSALVQQSPEWLEMRRSKIGASDAAAIMGVSPWKTPYQLWEEKLGLRRNESNAAMKRGVEMEEEARRAFEMQTGIIVFPDVIFHSQNEWMMASLDGIDIERKTIVEIKCPGKVDHASAMDGIVPEKYFPQLQHQMEVTGLDKAFYFSYTPKSQKLIEVGKDLVYTTKMIAKEQAFWRCVMDLEAPELIEQDYKIQDDDLWTETARKLLHARSQSAPLKTQLAMLEQEEEELKKMLIFMSGNSNSKGAGIKLMRIMRKGSIDYKSIPELQNVDLEKYRKAPSEFHRISLI